MTRRHEEVIGDAFAPDAKVARVQRVIEQGTFLLDFPQGESVFQQGVRFFLTCLCNVNHGGRGRPVGSIITCSELAFQISPL
eukprot:s37_g31.t1